MLDLARRAQEIAAPLSKADYDRNDDSRYALTFLVRNVGEFSLKVPQHVREAHPEVDWAGVASLRHVVDEELQADYERVWDAARNDIPRLVAGLLRFTPAEPTHEPTRERGTLALAVPHEQLAAFCEKWGVRKLAFFGSVVRDDFGPDSDVDVLVELRTSLGLGIIDAENELAALLGHKVDLLEASLLNRWMRANVLAEAVTVYVAG